jgi:hypothetical protein
MIILRHPIEIRSFKTVKGVFNLILKASIAGILIITVFSCKTEEKRPAGILSKEEMVDVLIEFYVAEEKVTRLNLPSDSADVVFEVMESKVLEKAAIQDSVFKRSFNYYMDRPREMELIYTALVDSMQLKEQRLPPSRPNQ